MFRYCSQQDIATYRAIVMSFSVDLNIDRVIPIVEDAPKCQIQHDITCADVTVQDPSFVVGHLDDFSRNNQ